MQYFTLQKLKTVRTFAKAITKRCRLIIAMQSFKWVAGD